MDTYLGFCSSINTLFDPRPRGKEKNRAAGEIPKRSLTEYEEHAPKEKMSASSDNRRPSLIQERERVARGKRRPPGGDPAGPQGMPHEELMTGSCWFRKVVKYAESGLLATYQQAEPPGRGCSSDPQTVLSILYNSHPDARFASPLRKKAHVLAAGAPSQKTCAFG
ncbi:MAG: hypothetical protein ACO35C_06485 [Pontimonas sp.]